MKTAMQQLIQLLELDITINGNKELPYLIDVVKEVYISKEKEQIKDAHFEGWNAYDYLDDDYEPRLAENYYNETFKNI